MYIKRSGLGAKGRNGGIRLRHESSSMSYICLTKRDVKVSEDSHLDSWKTHLFACPAPCVVPCHNVLLLPRGDGPVGRIVLRC